MTDQPPSDRPDQRGAPVEGQEPLGTWPEREGAQPPAGRTWPDDSQDGWRQSGAAPSNGMGIAALVLGILAFLAILIFPLAILLGIAAVVLGVLGRKKASRLEATNGGQAKAGMVLGIVAVVLGVAVGVLFGTLIASNSEEISDLADCLSDASSTAEQEACRERFESEIGAG